MTKGRYPVGVYSVGLIFVSARTNKRHQAATTWAGEVEEQEGDRQSEWPSTEACSPNPEEKVRGGRRCMRQVSIVACKEMSVMIVS